MSAGRHRRFGIKYDLLLVSILLVIAALIYIFITISYGDGTSNLVCEIKVDGRTVKTVDLSGGDCEFELPDNSNIRFRLKDNAIAFTESDCPDKICVNTGCLRRAGQSAVCLPNRVSIHIVTINGDNNDNYNELDIAVP